MSHITYKNGRPARVGDMVIHPALGHTGELAEIIGNEGEGRVSIGASGIKYGADITEWLHADDKAKPAEPDPAKQTASIAELQDMKAKLEGQLLAAKSAPAAERKPGEGEPKDKNGAAA